MSGPSFVVLLFGGPSAGFCDLLACPISAHGPFASRALAEAFAETMPPGLQPHVLPLMTEPVLRRVR